MPDPSSNEKIFDKVIRHAVFLERYKTSAARDASKFLDKVVLNDLTSEIERRLENIKQRGLDVTPRKVRRLRLLRDTIAGDLRDGTGKLTDRVHDDLRELASSEASFIARTIETAIPVTINLSVPSRQTLESLVTTRKVRGQFVKDWFKNIGTATANKINQQIELGITEGESVPDIMRRIRGKRGVIAAARRNVEAVVRTSVQSVVSHARETVYLQNDDVVGNVLWVSTLDERTSDICINLDGRVFPKRHGPRPPAHINCRSTTVPTLRSAEQMGLKGPLPPRVRASINGPIPADTTYKTWLSKQSAAVQDRVLGPTRGKLLRESKIKIDRFWDPKTGRRFTLAELRATDKIK